jgi:hypothetical protein
MDAVLLGEQRRGQAREQILFADDEGSKRKRECAGNIVGAALYIPMELVRALYESL